ncbi:MULTISPECIES: YfgM family protein [Legionella]|uniref:YfgM family protein n=1 Tax=Legionella TaxID=445 RepID=UPI000F8F658F|nr:MULTISPECIES: tetratricopeptide repeat protein [Legionella]MCP0912877.1 tetratricopeptide repeat protein [Legionella sp. 27cVA30]RUQ95077.1 tetratricopeptide repeat protein [Legionella septentrionalis]RUR09459.1 tetratricopeptide repeat protein [Legionella septentrionalis]RUR13709.1 tetratricopeptide repeat protein [Legionella septentrionalis]
MSVYMTEQEQIEAIKKWWQRYNGIITVIFSVILLAIAGYKYWSWHQSKITQQASNAYEHLMIAFSNHDNKGIRAYANQLIQEYNDTIYADAARLTLAKLFIAKEKYSQAQTQLQYVAEHSKMLALQQVAKIRMARLLLAEKLYDKALTALNQVNDEAYTPLINELKGDIYAATGQYPQAVASYRKAMDEAQTQGMGNLFLEMKTNELAALTHSMRGDEALQAA